MRLMPLPHVGTFQSHTLANRWTDLAGLFPTRLSVVPGIDGVERIGVLMMSVGSTLIHTKLSRGDPTALLTVH